ncbi:hypothetical protein E4U52_002011 [Claviceps spartinae]|nr:hypothetical protein E4U52_002011 [Claviceps spartinae]
MNTRESVAFPESLAPNKGLERGRARFIEYKKMISSNSTGKSWSEGRLREAHLADIEAGVRFVFFRFDGLFGVTDKDLLCILRPCIGLGFISGARGEIISWTAFRARHMLIDHLPMVLVTTESAAWFSSMQDGGDVVGATMSARAWQVYRRDVDGRLASVHCFMRGYKPDMGNLIHDF